MVNAMLHTGEVPQHPARLPQNATVSVTILIIVPVPLSGWSASRYRSEGLLSEAVRSGPASPVCGKRHGTSFLGSDGVADLWTVSCFDRKPCVAFPSWTARGDRAWSPAIRQLPRGDDLCDRTG
jgi:hypothetical protein